MSSVWSSSDQCDCIPNDVYNKYQRITYIKEKMKSLQRRKGKEIPDTNIFSYKSSEPKTL